MIEFCTKAENGGMVPFHEESLEDQSLLFKPGRGDIIKVKGKHLRVSDLIHDLSEKKIRIICSPIPLMNKP